MKYILRNSKPAKNVPGSIIVDRSPGGGPNGSATSGGAASAGMGLGLSLDRGDLSTKIEPYTFGSNASTPQAPSTQFSSQVHSSLPPPQQQQQQPQAQSQTQSQAPSQAQHLARRLSARGRESSEDPWVMVGDTVDSRSSSIASLTPTQGMQNVPGVQGMQNVPSVQAQGAQGALGMQGMPGGAAAPYNSPGFTQNSTVVSNANSNVLPINALPSTPSSPPPAPVQREMTRTPQGAKRPNVTSNPSHPGHQVHQAAQSVAANYVADPRESVEREGSIHSQHQQDKGWRGTLFGTSKERDKEANADLFRMIGFLTAAAPDDWSLVLEVCERASKSESASKEAAKALRSEFRYGQPSAQLSAARLWAIMLQNTSDTFISQTASRKFLESLESVINSNNTSPVVRERLLDVLASAAYTFGRKPGKEGFASTWRRVRPSWKPEEGVPFDPEDSLFESAFPRRAAPMQPPITPQAFPPQSGERERDRDRERKDRDGGKDRSKRDRDDKYYQQQQRLLDAREQPYRVTNPPSVPTRKDRGIIPPDEDIRRLFQECDVAKNNAQVLNNALIFAQPSSLGTDSLIQEFHNKCRASQELIVAQIPWASAGAERSRNAAEAKRASKESGSDNPPGKLSKKPPKDLLQNNANAKDKPEDLTKEEKLLAALLSANQELVEVFRVYEEMEKMALTEMEEREVAQRSMAETKMDRTKIHLISPDGSLMTDPPQSKGASSSSRSPSPSIGQTQTGSNTSSKGTSATSLPSLMTAPIQPSVNPGGRTPNSRDLPSLPYQSGDLLIPSNHANSPASALYQQTHSLPASPLQPMPHSPIPPASNQHPQNQQGLPNPPGHPYHHTHHSSNHSIDRAIYGANNLTLPHAVPHGPRQQPPPNAAARSRTPSPDRQGLGTGTPPTAGNHQDYAPPSHPPPTFNQNQPQPQHPPQSVATPRSGGARLDSLRSKAGSPTGGPPGLAPGHPGGQGNQGYAGHPTHPGHTASVGSGTGIQNVAGMRIDMDAANQYSDSDEELRTPVKPSEKALGKRRALVEQAPDEEELERREEAELEEAFLRSTAPPEGEAETPTATVKYVYDAAAERAKELDREEQLRRQQLRNSLIRPSSGDGPAPASQTPNTANANGKIGK